MELEDVTLVGLHFFFSLFLFTLCSLTVRRDLLEVIEVPGVCVPVTVFMRMCMSEEEEDGEGDRERVFRGTVCITCSVNQQSQAQYAGKRFCCCFFKCETTQSDKSKNIYLS